MEHAGTIREIPEEERPYEKCRRYGPEALSDAELLSVILRCGVRGRSSLELARDILRLCRFEEGLTGIHHLSVMQLQELRGVGLVKALQIRCIGELSKRIARTEARRGLDFRDPESVAGYYMESLRHEEQENVICMMLDTKNHFLGDVPLTRGTVNISLISPRELFLEALAYHAVHLILVHNHPSGDPSPSREDLQITERIRRAGELLGITLLDHIIIGDRQFVSLRQRGNI
jgi:DNA repair protein RadC